MFEVTFRPHVPVFYELDVLDEGRTLVIRIPKSIWTSLLNILTRRDFLKPIEQNLGIPSFIEPGLLPWGFGPVFMTEAESHPDWITLLCELPQLISSVEEKTVPWNKSVALSASLHWLFYCLAAVGRRENSEMQQHQLLEVSIGIYKEEYQYHLCITAEFSLAACAWLEAEIAKGDIHTRYEHPQLTLYMQRAYERLCGERSLDRFQLLCTCVQIYHPCCISFSTEGDRAGLGSFTNHKEEYGLELYDHNIDNAMQQLVLLVGVAGLHSLARKDGY